VPDPSPQPVVAKPRPAGEGEPRKAEVEALTSAALNHFVQNDYGQARKAVEKALALDPQNKKAKELAKILRALG
jgi:Tfp pilus assembly protein PilF